MRFKAVLKLQQEEVAANAVSGGKIAGTVEAGDDPVVRKRKQIIMNLRRNVLRKMYGDKNA